MALIEYSRTEGPRRRSWSERELGDGEVYPNEDEFESIGSEPSGSISLEPSDESESSQPHSEIEFIDDLFPHQEEGVRKLASWKTQRLCGVVGGILFYEMGLGKTRIGIELIAREKKERGGTIQPSLVVCPKTAIGVWKRDIDKFYGDELTYLILHPEYSDLTDSILQKDIDSYDIIITTYDVVRKQFKNADTRCFMVRRSTFSEIEPNLFKASEIQAEKRNTGLAYKIVTVCKTNEPDPSRYTPIYSRGVSDGGIAARVWANVIADESTKFSGQNTIVGNAMIAINGSAYFCLTGTPIMNYGADLYNMFKFMGLVMLKKEWNPTKYHAIGLASRIFGKKYEDTTIKLPEAEYLTVEIQLSELERKMYNEIVDKLKDAYSLFKRGEKTFAAPLEMFLRLRQICVCAGVLNVEPPERERKRKELRAMKELLRVCGPYEEVSAEDEELQALVEEAEAELAETTVSKLFDDPKLRTAIESEETSYSKITAAIDIIIKAIAEGHKVLVFSSFVQVLNALKREFDILGIGYLFLDGKVSSKKRGDMQKVFNSEDQYNVFLSSYKAGGMAIELTAADIVVLLEPWWNQATEEQAIGRAHRTNQTKKVTVYSLIAIPSFETYLLRVQNRKYLNAKEYLSDHREKYKRYKADSSIARMIIEQIVYGHI